MIITFEGAKLRLEDEVEIPRWMMKHLEDQEVSKEEKARIAHTTNRSGD